MASVLERREKLLDEKERADKDRCILARQIEQLTQHDPAMREKVRPKLDNYLEADRLARLLIITEICARELVCWITRLERCSAPSWEKFVYSPPEGVTTLGEAAFAKSKTRPPPDGIGRGTWPGSPFANPYAEAIRYYTHAPVENSSAILETVGAVMADLPKTLVGQSWLSDNLKSVLSLTEGGLRQRVEGGERGWKKPANGGLDFFFLLNSQPGKVANKTAAAFHAIHAAAWEKRHPNFVKFINEYNEVQEAKGQDQLSVHSRTLNQVKGLVQTFGVLQSALSVAAEIVKLHEKVKKGDGELEDWCRLSSKVGKTLASAESSIATWVMVATGKRVGIRAFSFAGAYGDACALLLGMVDYANSYEPAERTGRGIELAGMGLELAITYFGPSLVGGPWTLVLGLMVWAIMFAGETYRKEKNQAALFLKECEFGRSSRLGWAIMEQRRELEPIMYNFVWNLESDKWLNVAVAAKRGDAEAEKRLRRGFRPWLYLVIKPQYPHVCLSAYWTWKVKMLVEIPGMGMKLNVSFTASRKGLEQGDTASFPAQLRLKKDGLYYAVCEIDPALYPGEASFAQVTATGKVLLSVEGSLCQSDFRSAEEETRSTISTMVGLMTP